MAYINSPLMVDICLYFLKAHIISAIKTFFILTFISLSYFLNSNWPQDAFFFFSVLYNSWQFFIELIVFLWISLGNTILVQPPTQLRIPFYTWGWFSDEGELYYIYISLDFCFLFQIFGLISYLQVEGRNMHSKTMSCIISSLCSRRDSSSWREFNE